MDPRDLFRGIFGFDKHRFDGSEGKRNKPDRFFDDGDDDDDDDDDDYDYEDGSDIDHMFHHFHEEMQKQMEHLNQQMEEMFRHFGATEFPSVMPGTPSAPSAPENPRDRMLKPSEERKHPGTGPVVPHIEPFPKRRDGPSLFDRLFSIPRFENVQPFEKADKDLDDEIKGKDLSKILIRPDPSEKRVVSPSSPGMFSRHSSVSITTIRGADGKLEQKRTVQDSDGNEETTITRQVGDKTHTVQTKKDQLGVVEEKETFQNMDKDDLGTFNSEWKDKGRQPIAPRDGMILPGSHMHGNNSIFHRLFGFDFSKKDN